MSMDGHERSSLSLDAAARGPRLWLFALALAGCATIPEGRYGVDSVRIQGAARMDEEAVVACLGTRERARFSIDFGLRGTPECGVPPFDGDHAILDFWAWPWEEWPLFDESVLERDVERIERWYRARGFYDARVVATEVTPPEAAEGDRGGQGCRSGEDCSVDVLFTIEEGEPALIARISLRGADDLPQGMREALRSALQFQPNERFDEALFEATKSRMLRVLMDAGYADAEVTGDVKINRRRAEVAVDFVIASGDPGVVGRVCVSGYGSLPPQPILDVAGIDAGDTFSLHGLEEAQRALLALGVFSGVEMRPSRLEDEAATSEETASEETGESEEGEESGGGEERREGETTEAAHGTEAPVVQAAETPETPVCNAGPLDVPDGHRAVDIEIRVAPGQDDLRWGFGVGIQAGQAVTFGTVTSFAEQQDAAQWDLHLSVHLEHRNLFDRLIRGRLELRPRFIFEMPFLNFQPSQPSPFGLQTTGSLRWPASIERRTNFLFQVRYDLGPMPFTNFFRSELDGVIGLERRFFDGRVYGGVFLHANWFVPTDAQPVEPREELPQTVAVYLSEQLTIDLRDNPRNPTAGVYFAFGSQQAVQPIGFWDFVRFTGEARGYIPLPFGIVIAARFEIGVMEVFGTSLDPRNVYQLAQLGPPSLHLRGGGASSNRGFLPGLLGDVEQVYVTEPRSPDEIASGAPVTSRPVRISGGTRSWEASLELRIPLTTSFGIALFGDAGDVDRNRLGDPDGAGEFRFNYPQLAFGFGLRYHTIIGPLRFDVAIRPDELQVIGAEDSRPVPCTANRGQSCRPESRIDLGFLRFPGAFHLTIGEAF